MVVVELDAGVLEEVLAALLEDDESDDALLDLADALSPDPLLDPLSLFAPLSPVAALPSDVPVFALLLEP